MAWRSTCGRLRREAAYADHGRVHTAPADRLPDRVVQDYLWVIAENGPADQASRREPFERVVMLAVRRADASPTSTTRERLLAAGRLGRWHPHELRHSAASLLSAAGVPLEEAADVLGHVSARVTSSAYRHRTTSTVEAAVATASPHAVATGGRFVILPRS